MWVVAVSAPIEQMSPCAFVRLHTNLSVGKSFQYSLVPRSDSESSERGSGDIETDNATILGDTDNLPFLVF